MSTVWTAVIGCALFVATLLVPGPAAAITVSGSIDPALFGNLKQGDTQCPAEDCGPTAAINSFAFLQRQYPEVYGESLIPELPASENDLIDYAELVAAANTIGGIGYMANCVSCSASNGTYIEDFILGKIDYFRDMAPGTTSVKAQMNFAWRPGTANVPADVTHPDAAKPATVQDGTKPTAQFIADELNHGEDVEIFLAGGNGAGHYVTVTKIQFDTVTSMGKLGLVDPADGLFAEFNILGLDGGFLELDYVLGGANAVVAHAVSESPIPWPSALGLLLMGLAGVSLRGRIRRGSVAWAGGA